MKFRVYETVTNTYGEVVQVPQGPATEDTFKVLHSVISAMATATDRDPVLDRVMKTNSITIEFIPPECPPWEDFMDSQREEPPF